MLSAVNRAHSETTEQAPLRRRWTHDEIRVAKPADVRRSIKGAAIGNFMEWYDFGVYGYLASTIARVFFPSSGTGNAIGLIATFGTLAAAFAMRPLGGFVFGPLGDRIGRKPVLVTTVLLMTTASTLTGLLPSQRAIGVWAPILLITTRLLQGFTAGGEYVGAMVYVSEHTPDRKRGMMAGFLPLGTLSGYVFAAAMTTGLHAGLSIPQMLHWGWRVPFLVSAPLGVVALILRLRLEEAPTHGKNNNARVHGPGETRRQQFINTVVRQWRPLLIVIGLVLTFNVTNYMLTGYLPTYLVQVVHLRYVPGLAMILVVLIVLMMSVVFVAKLSDRIGVKPIMRIGCSLLIVMSIPAFMLIRFGSGYGVMFFGVLLIGSMLLCFTSVEPSTLPALFPAPVRYGAVAIGFNIAVSVFGGTTPLVAETLVARTGDPMIPAYMLIIAGVIGATTVFFMPEPAGKRLPWSGPIVETEVEAEELVKNGYVT